MIYILWSTSRPQVFINNHNLWLSKAKCTNDIQTRVAVDSPEDAAPLAAYNVVICNNPRKGIATPLYRLTKELEAQSENDIIVVASDDFEPPENWDVYLHKQFSNHNGALWVNDGHGKKIISIPIMTYGCLLKLNRIIYNPIYNHTFSDQELWDVLDEMGLIKDCRQDQELFEHHHPVYGKREVDESYRRSERAFHTNKEIYKSRKGLSIEQKLRVP